MVISKKTDLYQCQIIIDSVKVYLAKVSNVYLNKLKVLIK